MSPDGRARRPQGRVVSLSGALNVVTQAAPSLPAKTTPRGRTGSTRPVTRRAPPPTPHGWRALNLPLRATLGEIAIAKQIARSQANDLPDEVA